MNIKEKFLALTDRTYPHGTEQELFHLLDSSLKEDQFGNLFIKIGDSDAMFTSHLDTATKALTKVNHVFDGDIIKTDGNSILGADDKAGVTIMLYMIEKKIPGLYYFFLGEEVGCVGSRKVAEEQKKEKLEGINKVISFDRRGTTSVITFQSSKRTCSDKFGDALAKELNLADQTFSYKTDKYGVLTDSIQFMGIYPECTNISVGYQSEHTHSESQDIVHLDKLAQACLKVNWNDLPVDRDPSKTEYDSHSYGGWGDEWDGYYLGGGSGSSRYDTGQYSNSSTYTKPKPKTEQTWFYDELFLYLSSITTNSTTGKIVEVDIIEERVKYEEQLILELLKNLELQFLSAKWDGLTLDVFYEKDYKTSCDRNDLLEYLPDLDYRDLEVLNTYDDFEYVEFMD